MSGFLLLLVGFASPLLVALIRPRLRRYALWLLALALPECALARALSSPAFGPLEFALVGALLAALNVLSLLLLLAVMGTQPAQRAFPPHRHRRRDSRRRSPHA